MSTDAHGHHALDDEHNDGVEHEHSDVNIRAILSFAVGLFVTVAVCAVIIKVMFVVMLRQADQRDPVLSPLARPAGQSPPDPVLVTDEPAALAKFRAQEAKTLESYGWVDQAGGVARVPIAEAKKLLLQHGLPARTEAAPNPLEGTHAYAMGEASGGKTIK
ncbi:MAG: hypothetical protein ABJC89_24460 [Acidobacteriota bacterium]